MDPEHAEDSGPGAAEPRGAVRSSWRPDRWDVLVAVVLAVAIMGPGLLPGPMLNLDLLVTPEIPVPNGIWGLGPQLSQRTPLFVLFGVGSWILGGPITMKAFFVAAIVAGHLGMVRLVGPLAGRWARTAAGILWVGGPFIVTRLAVGHVQFLWLVAVLPWVLGPLLRPSRRLGSTFLAVAALAFGGPSPGTFVLALVAVGLLTEGAGSDPGAGRVPRVLRVLAVSAAASLLWVAPTIVLLWAGAQVSGSGSFVVHADGADGWLSLLAGGGFWNAPVQVGGAGWGTAAAGVILTALAIVGARRPSWWGRPLAVAGVAGLVLAASSALPGVSSLYEALTDLPFGAPLRESQRFSLLWLLWLAPASAVGAATLAADLRRRAGSMGASRSSTGEHRRGRTGPAEAVALLPLAAVIAVSVGGWWGMGGVIAPTEFPAGWSAARDLVRAEPGTTIALPWNEYYGWSFTDGRHTFNPLPDFLGGDVISSYDPQFDDSGGNQEQVDRRAWFLDSHLAGDGPLGPAFEAVNVRWVVLVEEGGACSDLPEPLGACLDRVRLDAEPDRFRVAIENEDVTVFEVLGWHGDAIGPDGTAFELDRPIPPYISTDAPGGSVLGVAGAPGWVRGAFQPVEVTDEGLLRLPEGASGPVWFWPAVPLAATYAAIGGVSIGTIIRRRNATPGGR